MSISVVFPAYNEEQIIEPVIIRSIEALREQFEKFEIVIVDDKSTDSTGLIADALAARYPEVRVIHNARNMKQGASLIAGMRAARNELVTHNAMDYPFDLRDLRKMTPLLHSADIVVASRASRPGYTPYRRFISFVNIMLLHVLFDLRLKDYNFVQLYKKSVLDRISIEARSTGFVTPEILIRAHDLGYRVSEIEIAYHARETGIASSGKLSVVLTSFADLVRFALHRNPITKRLFAGWLRNPRTESVCADAGAVLNGAASEPAISMPLKE